MMFVMYPSKKDLKAAIGTRLKYEETSAFGNEYKSTGTFCGSNRPSLTGIKDREFFAEITMKDDLIVKVA